jgi:hypothetical protein
VESALEQSKKELEKVQKSHEDDLSVIENLREKHERAMKIAEDPALTTPASQSL